jgi:bifunctional DNA-binding transcriptional regulator/antitoxin component of YhaV-PrlF toxin-antitoxin module
MQIARIPLRKINEALRITLPLKLTRELGLRAGDYVDLVQDNGSVKLAFVKVEPPAALLRSQALPQPEPAE